MGNNAMKPCPFCGGIAVFRAELHRSIIACGRTHGCSVAPWVARTNFREAQRAWNFRFNDKEASND